MSFLTTLKQASSKRRLELDFSTFTHEELYYLLSYAYGTKITSPQDRPDLPDEVYASLKGNFATAIEISQYYNQTQSAVISNVTPMNWDEKKAKIANCITTQIVEVPIPGVITKKEEKKPTMLVTVERVTIAEKVYSVPRVNGIPQLNELKKYEEITILPFSQQAANVAIAAGNLTEKTVDGIVKPAIGLDAMAKLKIPYLEKASVKSFCALLENMAKDMKSTKNGVHGMEWMNLVYNHLVSLKSNDCFYASATMLRTLFSSNIPFVRYPNDAEFDRIVSVDPKAKLKSFKVQCTVATLAPFSPMDKVTYNSAYATCVHSRDFRKTDGKGMSGANQGAYTGEFQTKATRNLRGKLTMISLIRIPKDMMLYIFSEDTEFLRHVPNYINKDILWKAVTKTKMAMPNVTVITVVPTLQNCAAIVFVEDSLPNLIPKMSFDDLVNEQKESLYALLQPYILLAPQLLMFPCKVLDLGWDVKQTKGYHVVNCAGPSPHNLEYFKCLAKDEYEAKPFTDRWSFAPVHDERSYLTVCVLANSFRNTWFMHRRPLEDIFAKAKCKFIQLLPLGLIPPLVPVEAYEIQVALDNGVQLSTEDVMAHYAHFESKSLKTAVDTERLLEEDDVRSDDDDNDQRSNADGHDSSDDSEDEQEQELRRKMEEIRARKRQLRAQKKKENSDASDENSGSGRVAKNDNNDNLPETGVDNDGGFTLPSLE
jgi:hypothetical protein